MWVDLNAIRSYIANSNVSFENRTVCIRLVSPLLILILF
uniref:Uncharacterized protein n=1 Tax=Arundo donax TaxID=35708 RepID=A0A0A8YMR4_ARUDO